MKRIVVFGMMVLFSIIMFGCASTNTKNLTGVAQNEKQGFPRWIDMQFDSIDAEYMLDGYKPKENGIFASGKARMDNERSTEIAARLDARSNLASRIKVEIDRVALTNGISAEEVTVEKVSAILTGTKIIDKYRADDGTLYLLMFISDKDAKASSKDNPVLGNLIDIIAEERTEAMKAQVIE